MFTFASIHSNRGLLQSDKLKSVLSCILLPEVCISLEYSRSLCHKLKGVSPYMGNKIQLQDTKKMNSFQFTHPVWVRPIS